MVWRPGRASRALLERMVRAGGQELTLGEVVWAVPGGATEETPTVLDRQDEVPVHLERNRGGREQQVTGVVLEGEWTATMLGGVTVRAEMVAKVTRGAHAGLYLRVVGEPERPMEHHWEVQMERVPAGDRVREQDVLA